MDNNDRINRYYNDYKADLEAAKIAESRGNIEGARKLYKQGFEDPETMKTAPHHAAIGRPDEVRAARNPVLRWKKEE